MALALLAELDKNALESTIGDLQVSLVNSNSSFLTRHHHLKYFFPGYYVESITELDWRGRVVTF
jgi:hypothetical protein